MKNYSLQKSDYKNILTGKSKEHLASHPQLAVELHQQLVPALVDLQQKALQEGFDLRVVSGFRSYERQQLIWEEKLSGKRKIFSHDGKNLLSVDSLSDQEKVDSILRWSAFPGTSRHHWGSDFDLYDANAIAKEDLQLIPSEYLEGGPLHPLTLWLDDLIDGNEIPFFKPYREDHDGVAIEPWHLSYRPIADSFLQLYTLELFQEVVASSNLPIKEIILDNAAFYYNRYVALMPIA